MRRRWGTREITVDSDGVLMIRKRRFARAWQGVWPWGGDTLKLV
jgi:hypothetical protein